jgi:hypothetical protein
MKQGVMMIQAVACERRWNLPSLLLCCSQSRVGVSGVVQSNMTEHVRRHI